MANRKIPLALKIGWTAWVGVWFPLYWLQYGPSTFLWFCDIANFVILAALWAESPTLFSWQACSVLLVQLAFTVDVLGRVFLGLHLVGGTEWIFDDALIPLRIRILSLTMHLATPPLLLWAVRLLGYDRRGLYLQILTACVILPVSYLSSDARLNLNWVWAPFNRPQRLMPPALFVPVCVLGYTVLLYLPTHLLLNRLYGPRTPSSR